MALTVATAGTGVARTAHYVTPTGASAPIQTLLLEPQRTNLCIRSEEFDTWTLVGVTVTANSLVAPDGATTADTLTPDGLANRYVRRDCTFTGNGEKCVAIYLKAGTAAATEVSLYDLTGATHRHRIRATWTAGVPTVANISGSGTIYPVEALANGWYRILFSATGVVAANTNAVIIYPATANAASGTVYAWGAQAENAIVPSSYIKTEGTTVTRNADSFYLPFTAPQQAMTVYVRGVEQGINVSGSDRIWHIGLTTGARAACRKSATLTDAFVDSTGSSLSTGGGSTNPATLGLLREFRTTLSAAGSITQYTSNSSGAEVAGSASTALGLGAAWSAQRLYLNSSETTNVGQFAFTHVAVVPGVQSMAEMRAIAGVS